MSSQKHRLPDGAKVVERDGSHYASYLHHIAAGATEEEAIAALLEKLIRRGCAVQG